MVFILRDNLLIILIAISEKLGGFTTAFANLRLRTNLSIFKGHSELSSSSKNEGNKGSMTLITVSLLSSSSKMHIQKIVPISVIIKLETVTETESLP